MKSLPPPPHRTCQRSMTLNTPKLRGMGWQERDVALGALAGLILEAVDIPARIMNLYFPINNGQFLNVHMCEAYVLIPGNALF